MRITRSFVTTSLAGTILALMIAPGAAPSLSPIGRNVANSYRCAVRAYDRARTWGAIARWWIDEEKAVSTLDAHRSPDRDATECDLVAATADSNRVHQNRLTSRTR
jgi:hypothetical protein